MSVLTDQDLSARRFSAKGYYRPSFIKQVVEEVEGGLSPQEVYLKYQLRPHTLRDWIRKYGTADYVSCSRKKYSGELKRSVCRAVLGGRMTTAQAASAHQIDPQLLRQWIRQQKQELEPINTEVLKKTKSKSSTPPVSDELKALQEQLAYANLKIAALNTLIDVAEQQLKINIRKKPGAKQS
jgi:transposase